MSKILKVKKDLATGMFVGSFQKNAEKYIVKETTMRNFLGKIRLLW